jgi:hypothetical protein
MNKIIIALWAIVTCFSIGCTRNVAQIHPNLPQKPLIERLPITVGVYYSEEFRSYECINPLRDNNKYKIALGSPSVTLVDQILSNMFEEVVSVQGRPPLPESGANINVVIEPKIVGLSIFSQRGARWARVELSYKFILYALNGEEITSCPITGYGYSEDKSYGLYARMMVREATEFAMRNVAAKFMVRLNKDHEYVRWLQSAGLTP